MEAKLDNIFLVVADLNNTGDPKKGSPQALRLTQSRLGIFFSDFSSGRPLAGWPMFVFLELDIRHFETLSDGTQYQELTPRVYTSRIPLGLLATDHVGYASYDLTKLPDLIPIVLAGQTNALPLGITKDEAKAASDVFSKEPVQLSINAIWIHPYGGSVINGLTPGLFSLRPDAIVVNALLDDVAARNEMMNAGIPSLQEPSIVDWRLSPGSFAITHGVKVGDEDCERFTPANVAVETYYFNRVVLQLPPPVEMPPTVPIPGGVPLPSPTGVPVSPAPPASPSTPSISPAVQPPVSPSTSVPSPAGLLPRQIFSAVTRPSVLFDTAQPTIIPASIFIYKTEWFQLGHSLGKVLYTLALAPGENADIAVIDWSREDMASRQEATALTESLIADLRRDRLITETIDGILNEKQSGGSTLGAGSLVAGAAGTTGPFGALAGLGLSLGGGSAWTEGHRDLHDSTVQTLSDRIQQSSSALRELRSTVVISSHQQEQNVITTRNLTNYNHSHTLTILYYELLRHLRVVTSSDRAFDALLVRFPDLAGIDRNNPATLFPYLTFLKGNLLDSSLDPSFAAYEAFEVELNRNDPQAQPTEEQRTKIRGLIGNVGLAAWKDNDPNHSALLMRVEGNSGPVAVTTKSQVDYDPGSAKVLDAAISFILPQFFGNDQDKEFRQWKGASFTLDFTNLQRWDELVEIKFQCLFKDESKDNQFNLRFDELLAITDHGTVDLNSMPSHITYMPGNNNNLLKSVGDRNDGKNTGSGINEYPLRLPASAKPARPPFERLSLDQQTAIYRLLNHVLDYLSYYSVVYWLTNDEKRISLLQSLGPSFDASYWPATIFGDSLVFPRLTSRRLQPDEFVKEERLITLPTRGVFADAKMGECNVSERIDNTRFWDWQKSPIPFQAPAITGVTPASHAQQPQGLQPTQFPTPLVSIQNAPAAPDPAIAAGLTALTTPNVFRDLSVATQVAGVVQQVTDAAKQVAIAASTLAKAKETKPPAGGGTSGGGAGGTSGGGGGGGTKGGGGGDSGGDSTPASSGGETSGGPSMTPQDALDRMQVLRSMQPEIGSQGVQAGARALASQLVDDGSGVYKLASLNAVPFTRPSYWYTSDLSDGFFTKLLALCNQQSVVPENLLKVMFSESIGLRAGSALRNDKGDVIAGGIQGFTTAVVKDIPMSTLVTMDAEAQLKYTQAIVGYWRSSGLGPNEPAGRIYLANFLPAKLGAAGSTQPDFVVAAKGDGNYETNLALDINKDGKITLDELQQLADTAPNRANGPNRWREIVSRLSGAGAIPPDFNDPWCLQTALSALGEPTALDGMAGPGTFKSVAAVAQKLGIPAPSEANYQSRNTTWQTFAAALKEVFASPSETTKGSLSI